MPTAPEGPLTCHVCGQALAEGQVGFSPFEYACPNCQTAYHVEGERVRCIAPGFVEHHATPLVLTLADLRRTNIVRHDA